MLEYIDAENLPTIYGGKCSCPGGCPLSDAGPWQSMTKAELEKIEQDRWAAVPPSIAPPRLSSSGPNSIQGSPIPSPSLNGVTSQTIVRQ